MKIENFYKDKIGLKEIELLILGLIKNKLKGNLQSAKDYTLNKDVDLFIELVNNSINTINGLFKNLIELDYNHQEILNNIPTYLDKIGRDEIPEIDENQLKDFKSQLGKMKGYGKKLNFLKHFLELDHRITYSREEFLKKISEDFSNVKINLDTNNLRENTNGKKVLDLPISDINLEGYGFYSGNLNTAIEKLQVMFDKVIENQIKGNFEIETINLIFLGNIINRNLILEQDFQESLINYNLTFEFSLFLLKASILLRKFFPKVNLLFSIEKSNFRPNEQTEHFRNYNINFDRIIPRLIEKKLETINGVNISEAGIYDYYNAFKYKSGQVTICYGDIKQSSQTGKIKFNNLEKKLLKEVGNQDKIKRVSRFYLGGKDLYFYNDFYRKIRQIPSFSDTLLGITHGNSKLVFFVLNENGEELEKNWIDVLNTEPLVYLHTIDYKKDIQYYDFIQNTILTNKKDKQNIILAL